MERINVNIRIKGIVQGVGFRPFLHRSMEKHQLFGWIRNTSEGVEIETEGFQLNIESFTEDIQFSAPELAYIENIQIQTNSGLKEYNCINILPSQQLEYRNTLISPDAATCPDCLRELFDSRDRRHRYAFINCTNCGPRFTIIRDIPYDRCNTTMAAFDMCPDCAREYDCIDDRRYHAQPDCCPDCGPELFYLDAHGQRMQGDSIILAAQHLREGRIIAVKGLGGIHLACRYDEPGIVAELRRRKHRDEKPMAVMCRDLEYIRTFCHVSAAEEALLKSYARPIVLLKKKRAADFAWLSDNQYLGVMLPYTPVHHLLLDEDPGCLVMTSANISDLPIIIENSEAINQLRGIADGFLLNNRDIENRCDDSLMRVVKGRPYPLRRSRGYVPLPLRLNGARSRILACGAEQKASFCLSRGEQVFQSAHIGDLKNAETLDHYEKQIDLFERLFDTKPELIACDLHPDYLSTDYARLRAQSECISLLPVQHHHAHMAACMADNELEGDCIGIIWDGTGYGTDGSIWGGEIFTGNYHGFDRVGSIRPIRLPGGDRAIKEISRIGISLLTDAGIDPAVFFPAEAERIQNLLAADLNCPKSSGMGRLFDGVSAILGICRNASYEGQGAVLLETNADENCTGSYPCSFIQETGLHVFDHRSMVKAICADVQAGNGPEIIVARFMNTLVDMACEVCRKVYLECGLSRVVLSGGVFQNMYLLNRLMDKLTENGFEVYCHSRVSANDEGIAFGQLAIAERSSGTYVPCSTAENC